MRSWHTAVDGVLYSYGLYRCGRYSYGLYSDVLYSYALLMEYMA